MQEICLSEAVRGMESATVRNWFKQAGDPVAAGEPLVLLETERAEIEIASESAGVLAEIKAGVGETVPVGGPLARMAGSGEKVASTPEPKLAASTADAPDAGSVGGAIPILMPQAGNTMEEGTVLEWKVAEGDQVTEGQILCEIETDKATMDFESPASGRLAKIVVPNGGIAAVKTPIAYLGDEAFDLGSLEPEASQSQAPSPKSSASASPSAASSAPTQSAPPEGAVVPVLMPQAGNTMEEGTVLEWKVAEGDQVGEGQILCEIETDKATMDFESPVSGRLAKIVVHAGQIAAVKTPIAYFSDRDEDVAAFLAQSGGGAASSAASTTSAPSAPAPSGGTRIAASAPSSAPRPASRSVSGRVKASPAARKAAEKRGLDLSDIGGGTGPGGRILSTDVVAYRGRPAPVAAAGGGEPVRAAMTKMRRAIATNLQRSKQTVPHFYVKQTIDAGAMFGFYREQKPKTGCTLNDVVNLACARAIAEFPAIRTRLEGDELVTYPSVNLGIAVGVDDGLVVPVVLGVDGMDLATLAAESKRLVDGARRGRLENIGQGVFTTTNLGAIGTDEFSAIINPPESGILAIGAIREAVMVSNGAMRAGREMTLVLSADHRVVDGVMAARFMARLKEILEAPAEFLL